MGITVSDTQREKDKCFRAIGGNPPKGLEARAALGGSVSLRFAPFDSNCFEVSLCFAAFDSNCFKVSLRFAAFGSNWFEGCSCKN